MKFILMLLFIVFEGSVHAQKCVKGEIEYSIATYSEEIFVEKKYGHMLDSLLKNPVSEYFCRQNIQHLPTKDKQKSSDVSPSESHVIEPLFIDISNFSGIYGKRIWPLNSKARRPTRFRCGFYHNLFIIANNTYVELTTDTIKNEKLIREHLKADFGDEELSRMTKYFKYGIVCDQYTYLPSFYIKRDEEVVFDAKTLRK